MTCLRSASVAVFACLGSAVSANGDPHPPQNLLFGGFTFPHFGQARVTASQPPQNFIPSGFSIRMGTSWFGQVRLVFNFPVRQWVSFFL